MSDLDTAIEYMDGSAKPQRPQAEVLSTKGLVLIPITPEFSDYSHWLNDPEVVKYSELRHKRHTHESCQEYVAGFDQVQNCMWTINVIGANCYIGNITSHLDPYNNVANMGMLIGEKWAWGRRFGREAWGAVMEWHSRNKTRRIEAGCMLSNTGMRKIMATCSMEHLIAIQGHFMLNGKPEAMSLYGRSYF